MSTMVNLALLPLPGPVAALVVEADLLKPCPFVRKQLSTDAAHTVRFCPSAFLRFNIQKISPGRMKLQCTADHVSNSMNHAMRQTMQKLDLQSIQFKESPANTWHNLHKQGPVITTRQPLLGKVALINRYDESQRVLKNPDVFSVDARRCGHRSAAGMRWWVPGLFKPLANNLMTLDGEEHQAQRKRVDSAFRGTQLKQLQPHIEHFANSAIDNFKQELQGSGQADFIQHVARPVPQWVISHLLGLDSVHVQADSSLNRGLSALGSVQGPIDLFRVIPAVRLISSTLREQIQSRRHRPCDDLLSRLISEQGEGKALSDDELLAMVFLLYVAGHETTTHLMSTALLSVLKDATIRAQITQPLEDRHIHEFVRYNSPVQISKPRFVLEDIEFAGARLRRGDTVAVLIGAANLDPNAFDNASEFVLERASARHLGFGSGMHTCFGLQLALRETAIVLNKLLFDSPVRMVDSNNAYQWSTRLGLRSLKSLMLTHR